MGSSAAFGPAKDLYLNPAAFQNPAPYTFGDAPRYLGARSPAQLSESLSALKDTRWMERYDLQFRMEVSNSFNRVVFGAPKDHGRGPADSVCDETSLLT